MVTSPPGSGTAADFDEASKTLRAAGGAAPQAIKADMGTLTDTFAELYGRLGKLDRHPLRRYRWA